MGKKKGPSLPDPPKFVESQRFTRSIDPLIDTGLSLLQGGFTDPSNTTTGFLNDLVTINPEATQAAIGLATRGIERTRDRAQQDIINALESNNQLTSSTTANRLGDLNEQFQRDISDVATRFFIQDVNRSLQNTKDLFGLGLSTTAGTSQIGLQEQAQINNFNQKNFENQLAVALNKQSSSGGLFGGLTGAAGGALAGLALAPFTGGSSLALSAGGGLLGGAAGAAGPQGTGTQLLQSGLGLSGLGLGGFRPATGSTSTGLRSAFSNAVANRGFGLNSFSFA